MQLPGKLFKTQFCSFSETTMSKLRMTNNEEEFS